MYIRFVLRAGKVTIFSCNCRENGNFPPHNTNIYKICKLRKTIFYVFYNISLPNFAILLILGIRMTVAKDYRSSCLEVGLSCKLSNMRGINVITKQVMQIMFFLLLKPLFRGCSYKPG